MWSHLSMPADAKILFRRVFDNDRLSLMAYITGIDDVPYIMLQTYHQGVRWFSTKGTNEICIKRKGSAIELKRWSNREGMARMWAKLYFVTWEGKRS
jgi:hypothetical protein